MLNSLKWFSKNWTPTKLMSLRWEMVRKRPNLFWSSWIEASTPLLHSCTSSPFRYRMLKFRYFEEATKIWKKSTVYKDLFLVCINRFDEISLIKTSSNTRLNRIFDTFYFHEKNQLKFMYREKATKIWKYLQSTKYVVQNKVGDFLKLLGLITVYEL